MDIQNSTMELENNLYTPPSNVVNIVYKQKCPFRVYTSASGRVEMMPCDPYCMALLWTFDQPIPTIQCQRLVRENLEN